jgi:hypothetical protein
MKVLALLVVAHQNKFLSVFPGSHYQARQQTSVSYAHPAIFTMQTEELGENVRELSLRDSAVTLSYCLVRWNLWQSENRLQEITEGINLIPIKLSTKNIVQVAEGLTSHNN